MNKIIFGIDIGGTTIKCGYFDESGNMLGRDEIPTRKQEGGIYILQDVADYIRAKVTANGLELSDVLGVGIGVPGSVRDDGTVNKCVNLGWGVMNVPEIMTRYLDVPKERIAVGNDANVAALGEYWKGGGMGYSSIMMITVGTGVGGGIIIGGKPVNGFNGAAAEIGHIPMADPSDVDAPCNCGKRGCLEQVASATGIARLGGKANAKEVFDAAIAGDADMEAVVEKVSMYLGKALATAAGIVDPECFIIGGGVCAAGEYFLERIRKYYSQYVFHPSKDTRIVKAVLGNDAGMYGAARLVMND